MHTFSQVDLNTVLKEWDHHLRKHHELTGQVLLCPPAAFMSPDWERHRTPSHKEILLQTPRLRDWLQAVRSTFPSPFDSKQTCRAHVCTKRKIVAVYLPDVHCTVPIAPRMYCNTLANSGSRQIVRELQVGPNAVHIDNSR